MSIKTNDQIISGKLWSTHLTCTELTEHSTLSMKMYDILRNNFWIHRHEQFCFVLLLLGKEAWGLFVRGFVCWNTVPILPWEAINHWRKPRHLNTTPAYSPGHLLFKIPNWCIFLGQKGWGKISRNLMMGWLWLSGRCPSSHSAIFSS